MNSVSAVDLGREGPKIIFASVTVEMHACAETQSTSASESYASYDYSGMLQRYEYSLSRIFNTPYTRVAKKSSILYQRQNVCMYK